MKHAAIICAMLAAILLLLADRLDAAAHAPAARACTAAAAIGCGIAIIRCRRQKG